MAAIAAVKYLPDRFQHQMAKNTYFFDTVKEKVKEKV